MSLKTLTSFLGTGIITGFVIGIILRELAFPGPSPPSSYDGFIGFGELSEKIAKLLLFVPAMIGGVIGLIAYGISSSRTNNAKDE